MFICSKPIPKSSSSSFYASQILEFKEYHLGDTIKNVDFYDSPWICWMRTWHGLGDSLTCLRKKPGWIPVVYAFFSKSYPRIRRTSITWEFILCLLFLWLVHSIIGSLYLSLPFTYFAQSPILLPSSSH